MAEEERLLDACCWLSAETVTWRPPWSGVCDSDALSKQAQIKGVCHWYFTYLRIFSGVLHHLVLDAAAWSRIIWRGGYRVLSHLAVCPYMLTVSSRGPSPGNKTTLNSPRGSSNLNRGFLYPSWRWVQRGTVYVAYSFPITYVFSGSDRLVLRMVQCRTTAPW